MKKLSLLSVLLVAAAHSSHADPVPMPPRVVLGAGARSAVVDVTNSGNAPETYRISVKAWRETPLGDLVLRPTSDLDVDVHDVTLPAGRSMKLHIRVRRSSKSPEEQRAYRLVFEVAPPAPPIKATASDQIQRAVGQVDMPVLVGGAFNDHRGALIASGLRDGHFQFALENNGRSVIRPDDITIDGILGGGETLFTLQRPGWYVLPKSHLSYNIVLSSADCARLSSLHVKAGTTALPLEATFQIDHGRCGEHDSTSFYREDSGHLVGPSVRYVHENRP